MHHYKIPAEPFEDQRVQNFKGILSIIENNTQQCLHTCRTKLLASLCVESARPGYYAKLWVVRIFIEFSKHRKSSVKMTRHVLFLPSLLCLVREGIRTYAYTPLMEYCTYILANITVHLPNALLVCDNPELVQHMLSCISVEKHMIRTFANLLSFVSTCAQTSISQHFLKLAFAAVEVLCKHVHVSVPLTADGTDVFRNYSAALSRCLDAVRLLCNLTNSDFLLAADKTSTHHVECTLNKQMALTIMVYQAIEKVVFCIPCPVGILHAMTCMYNFANCTNAFDNLDYAATCPFELAVTICVTVLTMSNLHPNSYVFAAAALYRLTSNRASFAVLLEHKYRLYQTLDCFIPSSFVYTFLYQTNSRMISYKLKTLATLPTNVGETSHATFYSYYVSFQEKQHTQALPFAADAIDASFFRLDEVFFKKITQFY